MRVFKYGVGVLGGYWLGRHGAESASKANHALRQVVPALKQQTDLILAYPEDVSVVIARDHQNLDSMVRDLRTLSTEEPHGQRDALALKQRIVREAAEHEFVEGRRLWPLVREVLRPELARQATEQEVELKQILLTLNDRKPGDVDFDDLVSEFAGLLAVHRAFEETEVLPALTEALTRKQRVRLGRALVKEKRRAPTRPHLSDLADPEKHPLMVKPVAMVDRTIDRLAARGEIRQPS